jgi:prophage maintenance system killer protein
VLELNSINIDWSADEVGDNVIALVQSAIKERDFAAWMRSISGQS